MGAGGDWKPAADAAMDGYARGDDSAFDVVYDLLSPRLYSFLLRRTRDAGRADDLLQETFLRMHSARRHFAPGAAVMPWAFAIARRLLIDGLRKDGRQGPVENDSEAVLSERPSGLEPTDAIVSKRRLAARILAALARMPEQHTVAFELVKLDGMSMREAAQALGITENAVKLRAFRTYEALRKELGDDVREELGDW
jgi:RNA polymerase sigma-70 factor (ECF subfamily)